MKSFNLLRGSVVISTVFAIGLLTCGTASAQLPSGKNAEGMNTALLIKLFGNTTNFIAKADAHVQSNGQPDATIMPMGFEMLAGKIRMDIDLAEVKSKEMSPEFANQMKQMGMDQMSSILVPDQKLVLTVYPGLKSYAEATMDKDEVDGFAKDYKIQKTHLGKETIDGHPCEKNNLTLTDDKGAKQSATVWNASDLKDFPIQIQITEDDSTLVMKFHDVKLGRPDDNHFAAPAGMVKYDSVEALLTAAVNKKMGAAATAK